MSNTDQNPKDRDRMERWAKKLPVFGYALLIVPLLLIAIPLFGFKMMFAGDDALLQFYPYAAFLKEGLLAGSMPLFSKAMLGGFPLAATMNGGFFHPLHAAIFWLFDFLTAYHILAIGYAAGGIFAMYALIRRLGMSALSAVFGALTFILSQGALAWLPILPNVQALFLFPMLFYLTLRLQDSWRFVFPLVLVLVSGWVGAAPQMITVAAVSAGVFALFLDRQRLRKWRIRMFSTTLRYVLAGAASAVIASPYLLFAQRFNVFSSRPLLSFAEYYSGAVSPVVLLRYLIPSLHFPGIIPPEALSIGFIPFFLAVAGTLYVRKEPTMLFFAGLAGMAALGAVQYSPVTALLHYIPVFSYFRGPARLLFVTSFALSLLAARGFYALEQEEVWQMPRRWLRWAGWFWAAVGIISAISTCLAFFFRAYLLERVLKYFDTHMYAGTSGLPIEHYHRVLEGYLDQAVNAFSWGRPAFAAVFIASVLGLFVIRRIISAKQKSIPLMFLCSLVAASSLLDYCLMRPFMPSTVLEKTAIIEFLRSVSDDAGPFRVFSLTPLAENYRKLVAVHPGDTEGQSQFLSAMLAPNTGLFWGIDSIDGYDNLMPRRVARILALAGGERSTVGIPLADAEVPDQERMRLFLERLPILGHLGVRYVISATELSHPSLSPVISEDSTRHRIPIYLYEYAGAQPILSFAEDVAFGSISEDALDAFFLNIAEERRSPARIACSECGALVTGVHEQDTVRTIEYRDGRAHVRTNTEQGRWLVFRSAHLPGWKASIDGNATPVYEADGLFQAVHVPSGDHSVEFAFTYRGALGI